MWAPNELTSPQPFPSGKAVISGLRPQVWSLRKLWKRLLFPARGHFSVRYCQPCAVIFQVCIEMCAGRDLSDMFCLARILNAWSLCALAQGPAAVTRTTLALSDKWDVSIKATQDD